MRDTDQADGAEIGRRWLEKFQFMLEKTQRIRDTVIPAEHQYDVLYEGISRNWKQSMEGIYDFLNMEFTEQAERGMQTWLSANAQHKHGAHKYALEDFGLEAEQVDKSLMFYRERYNIPYEVKNPHTDK